MGVPHLLSPKLSTAFLKMITQKHHVYKLTLGSQSWRESNVNTCQVLSLQCQRQQVCLRWMGFQERELWGHFSWLNIGLDKKEMIKMQIRTTYTPFLFSITMWITSFSVTILSLSLTFPCCPLLTYPIAGDSLSMDSVQNGLSFIATRLNRGLEILQMSCSPQSELSWANKTMPPLRDFKGQGKQSLNVTGALLLLTNK